MVPPFKVCQFRHTALGCWKSTHVTPKATPLIWSECLVWSVRTMDHWTHFFFEEDVNIDFIYRSMNSLASWLHMNWLMPSSNEMQRLAILLSVHSLKTMVTQERTIGKDLWPLHSPDLSLCNSYLWGSLKGNVYRNNPWMSEQLKSNMQQAMGHISHWIEEHFPECALASGKCIEADDDHFGHSVKRWKCC